MTERAGAATARRRTALPSALALVLCVALAACGDLPRPFQPAEKSLQAWSGPGDIAWGSILVLPVAGLPKPQSVELADEIVTALQVRDVPASTYAGGRGSIVLAGQVSAVTHELTWALVTPDGETALRFEEPLLDAARIDETTPDLAAIATRAARRITDALEPPIADEERAQPAVPVVLEAVNGAPGDGGIALARAMRHSLARIGVAVADDRTDDSHLILGRVSVARDDDAADDAALTIAWDVLQPDGTRLGTVTQSNRVPAAQLAGAWGALARIVAHAGAPGIARLLEHAAAAQMARAAPREAATEPQAEAPLALPVATSPSQTESPSEAPTGAPALPAIATPVDPPIALTVEARPASLTATMEARATQLEPPAETPPTPLFRPLPTPTNKPRLGAPIAVSIVVSAALQ